MNGPPTRRWVPAVVWCLLFAALHVYWALGGSVGLASSAGEALAHDRPPAFVAFGLWGVAVALLLGAAVVRRAADAGRPSRRWLRRLVVAVAVLLVVRGVAVEAALLLDLGGVRSAVGHDEAVASLLGWNPWFVVGGLAWGWAATYPRRDG